jgi:hypothetical protein
LGFDQVLTEVGKNDLIAEQLANLIVHHEYVHFFVQAHRLALAGDELSFRALISNYRN